MAVKGRATSYSDYFKGKTPRSVIDRVRRKAEDDDEPNMKIPETNFPSRKRGTPQFSIPENKSRDKKLGIKTEAGARAAAIKRRLLKNRKAS